MTNVRKRRSDEGIRAGWYEHSSEHAVAHVEFVWRLRPKPNARSSGASPAFTLLELMIALAIAAVLAVYAVPAWHGQVVRSHRVDAAAAVYRAAQFISGLATMGSTGESMVLPSGLDQAPQSGTAVYRLRVLAANESNGGYAIEAAPVEAGPMVDDACGVFVLDGTGLRSNRPSGGGETPVMEVCWSTR